MKNVLQLLFADSDLVTRQLVQDEIQYKRKDGVDEALRTVADKMFPDGKQAGVSDFSDTEVPILAIWGSEDEIIPSEHSENLPDHAQIEIIDGKGHMVQMEAAGKVNRLIEAFLSEQE